MRFCAVREDDGAVQAAECHLCGDAIYRGEEYYRINGESICCACLECFADKATEQKASGGAKVNASAALPVQKQ